MSHSINSRLPDEPILELTISEPFDYYDGPYTIYEEIGERIGNHPEKVYFIADITGLNMSFWNFITMRAGAYVSHPHSIDSPRWQLLFVSNSGLIESGIALENIRRAQFNIAPIRLFRTRDEALKYARRNGLH